MPTYAAFGYVIDSDIELPELPLVAANVAADWRIRLAPHSFAGDAGSALGSEQVHEGVHVRAFSAGDIRTLVFDDTGVFQVRPTERKIVWYPGPRFTDAAVRADLAGRVLALAAHTDGHVALHASAVSFGGQAIAFLGPKYAGKSTLAMALVRGGARLITDDTLIVRLSRRAAFAAPGVQQVRLWEDSARALGAEAWMNARNVKPAIGCLTPDELAVDAASLAACYVIERARDGSHAAAERRRLTAPESAMACVRFSKLGALTGGIDAPGVLDRAAAFARLVPVFTATVARDLSALERLAASFIAWHGERDPAVP